MSFEIRNQHSQHRLLMRTFGEHGDSMWAELDVYPGRQHEVRRRFGGMVASCTSEEGARAAFRLLSGEAEQAGPSEGEAPR